MSHSHSNKYEAFNYYIFHGNLHEIGIYMHNRRDIEVIKCNYASIGYRSIRTLLLFLTVSSSVTRVVLPVKTTDVYYNGLYTQTIWYFAKKHWHYCNRPDIRMSPTHR